MMPQIVLLFAVMVIGCQAGSYGGGMSSEGGSSYSMSGSGSRSYGSNSPISVSRKVNHRVSYYDTPTTSNSKPTFVEVSASPGVINFLFKSASSYINAKQYHEGAQGSNQESQSEDEAHVLKHQVTKPIIQELREIVIPQRKIVQEIRPVEEEIETLVSRSKDQGYRSGGSSYGSSGSSKSYGSGSKGGY